jgi:hypothetical protein
MRTPVDAERIGALMRELGAARLHMLLSAALLGTSFPEGQGPIIDRHGAENG